MSIRSDVFVHSELPNTPLGSTANEAISTQVIEDSSRRKFLGQSLASSLLLGPSFLRSKNEDRHLHTPENLMTPENIEFARQAVDDAFNDTIFESTRSESGEAQVKLKPKYEAIFSAWDDIEPTGDLTKDTEIALDYLALFADTYLEENSADSESSLEADSKQNYDWIFDAAGFALLTYRVARGMGVLEEQRGKCDGIKVKDYAFGLAINAASYMVGDDERRKHLYHNLIETGVAVGSIGTLVATAEGAQIVQKDIIKKSMKAINLEPGGLSEHELDVLMEGLTEEQRDKLQETLLLFEGETIAELQQTINESGHNIDIVGFLRDLASITNELPRTAAVRTLIMGTSLIGMPATSIAPTSFYTPLIRRLAEVEGVNGPELDKDFVSNLQGFIPNHLALSGLGFIPGYMKYVGGTVEKIPVLGGVLSGVTLGADMGPRLALKQLAGEHWPEVISEIDTYGVLTHTGMELAFAATAARHIARIEDRPYEEVLGEIISPRGRQETEKLFAHYGITTNFKDTTLGRFKRMKGLYSKEYNAAMDVAEQAEDQFKNQADSMRDSAAEFDAKYNTQRSISDKIRGSKSAIKAMFNPHKVEEEIGASMTDILRTLPLQSILVPNVQGQLSRVLDKVFAGIDKVFPDSQFAQEQLGDLAVGEVFGVMTRTCDNFAAEKAAVPIAIKRVLKITETFKQSSERLRKRTGAVIKKVTNKIINDGGGLPQGNMPNLIPFNMNEAYTQKDAVKRRRFLGRSAVGLITHGIDTISELIGFGPSIDPYIFVSNKHDGEHALRDDRVGNRSPRYTKRELFRKIIRGEAESQTV